MIRNQYQYYRTTPKFKWQRCNSGYCRLIYQDDQAQSNKYNSLIRRNSQNILGQDIENT